VPPNVELREIVEAKLELRVVGELLAQPTRDLLR
jgi:hypothetical protein